MKNQIQAISLIEMKDKYIGLIGTKERDNYERKLQRLILKIFKDQRFD